VTVFSAIVIREGRARDYRELVNIASSCAKQKEHINNDISIKEIVFCPKTRLYIAIYEVPASSSHRCMKSQCCSEKEREHVNE